MRDLESTGLRDESVEAELIPKPPLVVAERKKGEEVEQEVLTEQKFRKLLYPPASVLRKCSKTQSSTKAMAISTKQDIIKCDLYYERHKLITLDERQ